MKEMSAESVVSLIRRLEELVNPHISEEARNSQLFVDIADSYQACGRFLDKVDDLLSTKLITRDMVHSFLVEIDVNLLEHLAYHIESLRSLLPNVLAALEDDSAGGASDEEA